MAKAGWMVRQIHFACEYCHRDFSVRPSRMALQRSPVRFCSRTCKDRSQVVSRGKPFACSRCRQVKAPEEFYVDRTNPRGRVAACKACYSLFAKKVIAFKPYHREEAFQAGAKRRGFCYELTRDEFMAFWQKPCAYCGDHIPTIGLDRIDNTKGYTIANVVPCCTACNRMKSNLSLDEFIDRCRRIAEAWPLRTVGKMPAHL